MIPIKYGVSIGVLLLMILSGLSYFLWDTQQHVNNLDGSFSFQNKVNIQILKEIGDLQEAFEVAGIAIISEAAKTRKLEERCNIQHGFEEESYELHGKQGL